MFCILLDYSFRIVIHWVLANLRITCGKRNTFMGDFKSRVEVHSKKFFYISRCLRPFFLEQTQKSIARKIPKYNHPGEGAFQMFPYEFLSKACKQKKGQGCVTLGSKTKETCPKLSDLIGQARSLWIQGVCNRVWVQGMKRMKWRRIPTWVSNRIFALLSLRH